jgi:hypothetical protein
VKEIFPTAYFGSVAYFSALVKLETVGIEAHEHFPKQSLRNRCKILTANGFVDLSIPVVKISGSKTPIHEILVDDSKDWRNIHWKSIKSAYSSAPYYEHYAPELELLLYQKEENLLRFNQSLTQQLLIWLDYSISMDSTNSYQLGEFSKNEELCAKQSHTEFSKAPYIQVFPSQNSYMRSISILDMLFCEGPITHNLLMHD